LVSRSILHVRGNQNASAASRFLAAQKVSQESPTASWPPIASCIEEDSLKSLLKHLGF
jgi:hypothetical protein